MTRAFWKRTALILVLALSLGLFSGCELPPEETKPTETSTQTEPSIPGYDVTSEEAFTAIDPDYFELICENCDVTVYAQEGGVRAITFTLLSAQPLGKYDVTIGSDQGVTKLVRLLDGKTQMQTAMPFHVFLCYKGFDWKAYAQQMQTAPASAEQSLSSYKEEWERCKFKRLFSYQVQVYVGNLFFDYKNEHNQWVFPQGQDTVAVGELTVTVKGQSKTYHPKCLRLTNAPLPEQSIKDLVRVFAGQAFSVQPSAAGDFYYNALWLRHSQEWDVAIDGIDLPMPDDLTLGPCPYAIYTRSSITYRIRSGTLQETEFIFPGNHDLKILLHWTDPEMAGTLGSTGLAYFTLYYYEVIPTASGEKSERRCLIQPIVYNIFGSAYEYYAWAQDGVDIMSYYRDYVAVTQEVPVA